VALLVIQGVLPIASLYLLKLIIDAVASGISSGDIQPVLRQVTILIILEGVVTLVNSITRSVSGLVAELQGQAVTDRAQDIIHGKSIEADLEYYENAQYYDTLHRAQQEAPYRPIQILSDLLRLGQNGISLTAIAGLLVSLHWIIGVMLVFTAAPGMLARLAYSRRLYQWQRERTPIDRLSSYLSWILTHDTHAKEVRLFDLGEMFRKRYQETRSELRKERAILARERTLVDAGAQFLATLGVFGTFIFIAYRTVQGATTIGDLVMYYQAFQRGQAYVRELLGSLAGLYEDNLFLSYLYEFLDIKQKVLDPPDPLPVPRPLRSGITFEHVSFTYPHGAHPVVEDINLTIRPGEVVALVGENGSGKTTLCKLLCRLYDPSSGAITVDGISLPSFSVRALRKEISVIFQDYAHYNLTARENIWVGNIALSPDDPHIELAAHNAGAHDVIERLPKGYDTVLGKWFDAGEELSIGEWQKVALARSFLRDAQIIVLDEPTSAMDAKTEYEVFSRFRELVRGKSAMLVSHRFSTVRMADTIYVMENGRITESGSHDELIRRAGAYARLFEIQAQSYR
jgi:ATP-binding cassette subfamily B protein